MAREEITDGAVRELPKNIEAEQLVLGAFMLGWGGGEALSIGIEALRAEDFYLQKHRILFRCFVNQFAEGIPTDIISMANALDEQGDTERAGGRLYLNELLAHAATSTSVEYYCQIIRKKSALRSLIEAGAIITESGYDEVEEVEKLLDQAEGQIFAIAERGQERTYVSAESFLSEHLNELEARHNDPNRCVGVRTHFPTLDGLTGGLMPSDLIVIAGRPGTGKSSLVLAFVREILLKGSGTIAFFSLEMSKEQVLERLLTGASHTDLHKLRTGFMAMDGFREIVRVIPGLHLGRLLIDDSPGSTVMEIRSRARRISAQTGDLALVVVDYLQLMDAGIKTQLREQEIAYITRSLKRLARELNVPVVGVSQLSRKVEERDNKRPRLSDLRESGAIEQDSDVVLFIYRCDYYEGPPEDGARVRKGVPAELIVAKQRNGPPGIVRAVFLKESATFHEAANERGSTDVE